MGRVSDHIVSLDHRSLLVLVLFSFPQTVKSRITYIKDIPGYTTSVCDESYNSRWDWILVSMPATQLQCFAMIHLAESERTI